MSQVRWTYGAASVGICAVLVLLSEQWAAPDSIDAFTYWCGAATLVALIVAVGEIIHAGSAATAVNLALSSSARQDAKVLSLEVIALVDEVSEMIRLENYTAALRAVQIARRFAARLDLRHVPLAEGHAIASQLGAVEHGLHRIMTIDKGRPMSRAARTTLGDTLMCIKGAAEAMVRREDVV